MTRTGLWYHRRSLPPAALLRAVGALLLAILLATCGDEGPSGPSQAPVFGSISATPVFPSGQFTGVNLPIDRVHAIVVRPPETVLKDTTTGFDPNTDQLQLRLPLLLRAAAESLDVTLELLSGAQVLFSGTRRLEARAGAPSGTPPPPIPLTYGGPGAQLATLTLGPRDSSVTQGDSLFMRVLGQDANQVAVPQFYVSFSSSDTTVARVNATGLVRGRVPRGMVYIRARTPATQNFPQGVVDSTTVMLVPLPASLVKVGGDNQSAPVSAPLPLPLAVEVRAGDNLPVPNVAVTFAVLTGGGTLDSATVTSDAQGVARTTVVLGGTIGAQTFSASAAGAGSVTFSANATVLPSPTWTGAVSTNWNTAGNWNLGAVPGNADSVTIPAGPANQPALTSNVAVAALRNDGTIAAGAFAISIAGNLRGTGSITGTGNVAISPPGAVVQQTAVPNLLVMGTAAALGGNLTVTNDLTVMSTGGNLSLGGHTVTVGRDLLVVLGATMTMTNPLDTARAARDVMFNGASTSGLLTTGALFVGRHFNQVHQTSNQSFAPTGNHLTIFNGTGTQNVTFATPGAGASNFETVVIANPAGGVTLGSDIFQAGPVAFATGVPRVVHGNGHTLFVAELLASNATLDNLLVVANNVAITQFDSITFTNYSSAATPLTIVHPGGAVPFVFDDLVFQVTPTSGFYISVTDNNPSNGLPLTIDLVNPTPATGAPFIQTAGGAVVNWPAVPGGTIVWTGAASGDWFNPANWSPATVPGAADDVDFTQFFTNAPTVTASTAIRSLAVTSGRTITVGSGFTLTINGDAVLGGTIAGPGSVVLAGSARQLGGVFPGLTIQGDYTLAGTLLVNGPLVLQGDLTVGANTMTLTSDLDVIGTGRLIMTSASGLVQIPGHARFAGPSTVGSLTAGFLQVGGDFIQSNTVSANSFTASGTHQTVLVGAGAQTIAFDNPGVSGFQNLIYTGTGGSVAFSSDAEAFGTLLSISPVTYTGNGHTLKVDGLSATGATFDHLLLVADAANAAALLVLDQVVFQNYPGTATQVSITHPGATTPFVFNNLTFTSMPTAGGFYLSATDQNPSDGNVLTIDMNGPTPASGSPFVQTAGGAVVNWTSGGGGSATWTGAISNDWFVPGNWSGNQVPGSGDDVIIPPTAQSPALSAAAMVGSLTVNASAALNLAGFDLTASGSVSAPGAVVGGRVIMVSHGTQVSGNLEALLVQLGSRFESVSVAGPSSVSTLLEVSRGQFVVGAQTVIAGEFVTSFEGILSMTHPSSVLDVLGDATFAGEDPTGVLTAGLLLVGGDFTQVTVVSQGSFVATGSHTVELVGTAAQQVSFTSPGTNQSRFQNLVVINQTGPVTLASDIAVSGNLLLGAGGTQTLQGSGRSIQAGTLVINGSAVFDGINLVINDQSGVMPGLQNITFSNQDPTRVQLQFNHPGANTALPFSDFVFSTVPTSGQYLVVNDLTPVDNFTLTVDMVNPTPGTDGGFSMVQGGAVLNWPAAGGGGATLTWTGVNGTGWSDPGNWDLGRLPSNGDNVVIPAGTPNEPVTATSVVLNDLTIQSGATLTNADAALIVTGDLTGGGSIDGLGVEVSGSASVINMTSVSFLVVGGQVSLANALLIQTDLLIVGALAVFDPNGHDVTLVGNLTVQNDARLAMLVPSTFAVGGFAAFDGGDETGFLKEGLLQVAGDFVQLNTTSDLSFAPSGNHVTALGASSALVGVRFFSPGTGGSGSHFANLDVTPAEGGLDLSSAVIVDGTLTATPTGTAPTFFGNGNPVTAMALNVTRGSGTSLVLDDAPLVVNEQGSARTQTFDRAVFQNFPTGTGAPNLLDLTLVGTSAVPRPVTFTAPTLDTALGAGGLYVKLVSSNAQQVTVTISGSNDPTGGPSRSDPPFGQVVNGARIVWQ